MVFIFLPFIGVPMHDAWWWQIVRVLVGNSPLAGSILKSPNHVRVIMEIVGQAFGLPIKVALPFLVLFSID